MKKNIIFVILIAIILVGVFVIFFSRNTNKHSAHQMQAMSDLPEVLRYTCGMHPDVNVSPEEYKKGKTNCPICNMKLTPVYKEESKSEKKYYGCGVDTEGKCPRCDLGQVDSKCICGGHSFMIEGEKINCPVCQKPLRELTKTEADKLMGVVSRVRIKEDQIALAGIQTEPVSKEHLYKEIRTVGKVAYDPELAIAEEEFISALDTLDKIKEGTIEEIKERAKSLVESSKRKLRLLGLSEEQIEKLKTERKVHTSLILPEEKMWVYGEVYEYELSWVKTGEEVIITTPSFPDVTFKGNIFSTNPVINPRTRSLTFRTEVENPDLKLIPEMYVDVTIMGIYVSPNGEHNVLAIPKDAVLDTGRRRIVWVEKNKGEYEGREVVLGPEAAATISGRKIRVYPVLKGLTEGENVVVKANFLIDSQSQITGAAKAAYGGALGSEAEKAQHTHQH